MKIAILGYGRMGKMIEHLASTEHKIVYIKKNKSWDYDTLKKADVAIEFSIPNAAFENIKTCIENNIPVVSGTTGWLENINKIEGLIKENNGSFLYGSNFSISMNIFFKINQILANYMNTQNAYACHIDETHHIHKLDKPSGTAITLANAIINSNKKYHTWTLDHSQMDKELFIDVKREGEVTGYHSINYISELDEIRISHNAKKRESFALGAIESAKWLIDKKGSYRVSDFMNDLISKT